MTTLPTSPLLASAEGSAPWIELVESKPWPMGKAIVLLLAGIVMWAALLDFPSFSAGAGLDESYGQALAHFLKHHFQAGKDWIFTYGPLGYFVQRAYDADLFWCKFLWEVAVKLVFVITVLRVTATLTRFPAQLAFCALIIGFAKQFIHITDGFYMFVIVATGILTMAAPRPSRGQIGFLILVVSVFSLVKFTFFVLGAGIIAALAFQMLLQRQRRLAFETAAGFLLAFMGLWLALGQHLLNLPAYLYASLQVATGYVEAMALNGERSEVHLALAVTALFVAALATLRMREILKPRFIAMSAVLGMGIFLQWRHGFVRQDAHVLSFFAYMALLPFLLPAAMANHDWKYQPRVVALAYCVLFSLVGMGHALQEKLNFDTLVQSWKGHMRWNAMCLFQPTKLQTMLEAQQAGQEAKWQLPKIAAYVGDAPVDLISYEQGVLLLNKLNWRPRPIFQSYSAYTSFLSIANARFLDGDSAPEYLIFKLEPIDSRFPTLDDSLAMLEMFKCYDPVLAEKSFLLLKHNRGPGTDVRVASNHRQIRFNEEVTLVGSANNCQRIAFDIGYSLQGHLRKFFFRPPLVQLRVRTADNQTLTYRLLPALAEKGFLINPLLQDNSDIVKLYGELPGKRIVSFSVVADKKTMRNFKDEIETTIEELPHPVGEKLAQPKLNAVLYPMFATVPSQVTSTMAIDSRFCDGREVLLVHPDGQVVFDVPAGTHQVRGNFGMVPDAYLQGKTDGVVFKVEWVPAKGQPALLFERSLDPVNHPNDRGAQALALTVPPACPGQLRFRTSNAPGKNPDWDWSYWSEIRVE